MAKVTEQQHSIVCVCIPYLVFPFICQGAFSLLPCLGYCNSTTMGFVYLFELEFSSFPDICPEV